MSRVAGIFSSPQMESKALGRVKAEKGMLVPSLGWMTAEADSRTSRLADDSRRGPGFLNSGR